MESNIILNKEQIYKEAFKRGFFDFITVTEKGKHFKQEEALNVLTDKTTQELLYGGAAGGAKAQSLDSIVYTAFGKKRMGDIKIGDVICHPSGTFTNVIAIHPQGIKKLYEVEFIDGAKTKVCGDHLWYCWFASDQSKQEKKSGIKGKIQTTEMLIKKLHRNPIIPLCKPINFTLPKNRYTKDKLITPYVLGALIGDGSLTKSVEFCSVDIENVIEIERELPNGYRLNTSDNLHYSITYNQRNSKGYGINPMYDEIRAYGLNKKSECKFIPPNFLHECVETRIALVQGLMDTDGTIDKRGHCSYSTSSYQLALDFQYIIRSLGFKGTLKTQNTKCLDNYRIYIQGEDCSILFRLPRKKERVTKFNGGFSDSGRRIIAIRELEPELAQCITVDNPDGLYITDDFIVTHNSWTGCAWLLFSCLIFPNTKWFIGREELKRITESTLITFFKVAAEYGITSFKYNGQKNFIQFANGSRIDLLELKFQPSDPMFERFGSTEYTGGWIEEGGETHFGAYEILNTRIGRHLNDFYGIIGKMLITANPKNNWLYTTFYLPAKKGILEILKKYITVLVDDNPHIDSGYVERLDRITNQSQKKRLRFGDWEYDDDPTALCSYEKIISIFTNNHVEKGDEKYIIADIARFGSDKARIGVFYGWVLVEHHEFAISATTEIQDCILAMRVKHKVEKNHCLADEDGVGGGVVDNCEILGFTNNAAPFLTKESKDNPLSKIKNENYFNLQTQCIYGLAEVINETGFYIECPMTSQQKEEIALELSWMKTYKTDDERKLRVLPKEIIKQNIGHSPDWRDLFMMRYYFELVLARKVDFGW